MYRWRYKKVPLGHARWSAMNAGHGPAVRGRPGPVFGVVAKACFDGISFDVAGHTGFLNRVSHQPIVIFTRPERLSTATQDAVGFSRALGFDVANYLSKRSRGLEQHVDVVRHNHPGLKALKAAGFGFAENIDNRIGHALVVKPQRPRRGSIKRSIALREESSATRPADGAELDRHGSFKQPGYEKQLISRLPVGQMAFVEVGHTWRVPMARKNLTPGMAQRYIL